MLYIATVRDNTHSTGLWRFTTRLEIRTLAESRSTSLRVGERNNSRMCVKCEGSFGSVWLSRTKSARVQFIFELEVWAAQFVANFSKQSPRPCCPSQTDAKCKNRSAAFHSSILLRREGGGKLRTIISLPFVISSNDLSTLTQFATSDDIITIQAHFRT